MRPRQRVGLAIALRDGEPLPSRWLLATVWDAALEGNPKAPVPPYRRMEDAPSAANGFGKAETRQASRATVGQSLSRRMVARKSAGP